MLSAVKFGFTEDEVEARIDDVITHLMGVSRRKIVRWIREEALPVKDSENNTFEARKQVLLKARNLNIPEVYARRLLNELMPAISPAISLGQPKPEANRQSTSGPSPNKTSTSETPDSTVYPEPSIADPVQNSAKSFYRRLVFGGTVSKNLIYLTAEKSPAKAGSTDLTVVLKEASNKQGSFVVFVDGDKGWVFPNPSLVFRRRALATVFPSLTEDEYRNSKQSIEPVPVVRNGNGLWRVIEADKAQRVDAAGSKPDRESETRKTSRSFVEFPILAADCLKKVQDFATIVRHETVRNILVSGPNGKGELALIDQSELSQNAQPLVVVPRITLFRSVETFHNLYEKYYHCAKPAVGFVWIIDPATVGKVEHGWRLIKKGVLRITDSPAREEGIRPAPQPTPAREETIQPAPQSTPAREESIRPAPQPTPAAPPDDLTPPLLSKASTNRTKSLFVGAIMLSLGLVLLALITWELLGPKGNPGKSENMMPVEGARFLMGTNDGYENERPQHRVTLKPFLIDKYEVTREDYEKFVKTANHRAPFGWTNGHYPLNTGRWPVTGVDWNDADAYCKWIGKRLPTEEEWEFAARGTDGRKYPWGNDWQTASANAENASSGLTDVDKFKEQSPYGAVGMVGNAWEWTASKLAPYPGGRLPPNEVGDGKADLRVIRGGSWESKRTSATTTYRWGWPSSGGSDYANTGFRCVKDPQA